MTQQPTQTQDDSLSFREAVEHFQRQEYDLAIALFESYYRDHSGHFDTVHRLGACYVGKKEYAKALEYFQIALGIESRDINLNLNIAKTYVMSQQFGKAHEQARICLGFDPNNGDARAILNDTRGYNENYRRAIQFYREGKGDLALPLFEEHLKYFPSDTTVLECLGILYCGMKNYERGVHFFHLALSYDPNMYSMHYNIALAFYHQQQYDKALGSVKISLAHNPKYKSSLYLLDKICREYGDFEQASSALRDYLTICAEEGIDSRLSFSDLIYYNLHLFRWSEVMSDFGELVSGDHSKIKPFPALLVYDDLALLRSISSSYSVSYNSDTPLVVGDSFKKVRSSGDKIRVGYMSSDIHHHPVFNISSHLFREHDRGDFEVYLYSTAVLDEGSDAVKFALGESDFYRDIKDLSDGAAYDLIRGDDLDIMVDLIGYTGGKSNRKYLLAMRLAPALINYLGYMGTVGTSYHDYIIGDEHVIPRESVQHYTEEVLYVDCVFSYDRGLMFGCKSEKVRSDFGLPAGGIILAAFNQAVKITESMFIAWMRILESCPDSYLWVSFKLGCSREAFVDLALERGISADRIIVSANMDSSEYMRRYDFCDLALDTYPYNGGMTSLDALHGCCPILTMSGETMMSRMTGSLLKHLDLGELVADSIDDYVEKAIGLIRDGNKLRSLRKHIGDRLGGSAIYDSEKMTRQLEEHYRAIVSKNSVEG